MSKFKDLFLSSYNEFKNVRCIVLAAMFGAISMVLGSMTIMIGEIIKIGFTFLPNEFVYYLFGPFFGAVYGAAMDILNYIANPKGAFFPGFTFSAILTGIIYGLIMYKRPLSLKRIMIANVIRTVFVDMLLNTYWLTMLTGNAFMVMFPLRVIKLMIMLPIESILLFMVIKAVEASKVLHLLHPKGAKI